MLQFVIELKLSVAVQPGMALSGMAVQSNGQRLYDQTEIPEI